MGLKQQSKVFILNQGSPDKDIKVVIKEESVVEFRLNNNDALMFVMAKEEVVQLCQEFYPNLVIAP